MKYAVGVLMIVLVGCSSPTAPSPTPPVVVVPPVVTPPIVTPSLPTSDPRFDLTFYRRLVHDAIDGNALPLHRWSRAPLIYLRTVDDRSTAVSAALVNQTAAAIINTVGQWTGSFGVAGLEQGTSTRAGQAGWITVQWSSSGACGSTDRAGSEGAVITMNHLRPECTCGPLVAKHELGHALGFYHTQETGADVMAASFTNACDKPLSAREQYHASVAYTMPIGSPAP